MTQRSNNVLRVNAVEELNDYLEAVAEILRNVQNDHKVTLLEIAEATDVSLGTISNAANKKGAINAMYLSRIGKVYGVEQLDPYAKIAGGQIIARQPDHRGDILPTLTLVAHTKALHRCPSSEGGTAETLREQLSQLSDLRRLRREIDSEISAIEARRDAA